MTHTECYNIITGKLDSAGITVQDSHKGLYQRITIHANDFVNLYLGLYGVHPAATAAFEQLIQNIIDASLARPQHLRQRDEQKGEDWFLSNSLAGMSLYVDRFCGDLPTLRQKLDYFRDLGINVLHLMPLFESPPTESDGGYAVSDFRKVDARFGTLDDVLALQRDMQTQDMYLMLDIVLNHTSQQHAWATAAREGDKYYQDYYYFFDDRSIPNRLDRTMPEVFPEAAPGNFTYIAEIAKWVMTVFHSYQWDLNYRNPLVLAEMVSHILFYANTGVDIIRIDAPAFIWKELDTTCQNLPQAHTVLQLIKQCVITAAPGTALLGEAIVSPSEIMKYFGTGDYIARECDFAYNATHMALQLDALATGDTRVMLAAQHQILQKPYGTSWITYTRCHDDIGLGFDDATIEAAGFNAYEHRRYLKDYFSGQYPFSPAKGSLFSVNEKTGDARISGTLASLCGLEKALADRDEEAIAVSIRKICLMQAHSFFLGGLPMLFYGDEQGYTNDYTYLADSAKSYDNRWMHRPLTDWNKNALAKKEGTVEQAVYSATQKLLRIRSCLSVVADRKNLTWLTPHNIHVAGYLRAWGSQRVYCLFNFSAREAFLTWHVFKEHGLTPDALYDHWSEAAHTVGRDDEYLILQPYRFYILEPVS